MGLIHEYENGADSSNLTHSETWKLRYMYENRADSSNRKKSWVRETFIFVTWLKQRSRFFKSNALWNLKLATHVRGRSRFFKLENIMNSRNPYFCSVTQPTRIHKLSMSSRKHLNSLGFMNILHFEDNGRWTRPSPPAENFFLKSA